MLINNDLCYEAYTLFVAPLEINKNDCDYKCLIRKYGNTELGTHQPFSDVCTQRRFTPDDFLRKILPRIFSSNNSPLENSPIQNYESFPPEGVFCLHFCLELELRSSLAYKIFSVLFALGIMFVDSVLTGI